MASPIPSACARRSILVLSLGLLAFSSDRLTGSLSAQLITAESERFEVASIHPSGPEGGRPSFRSNPGGGIQATNVTLKLLIQMAYDLRPEQLMGGPAWTESDEYTVIAKAPEGRPSTSETDQQEFTRKRLRALLSDRFHLKLKRDATSGNGYVLRMPRSHKMTVATDPGSHGIRQVGRWEIRAEGVDMSLFAHFLSAHLGATVADQTGLEGRFNFHLNWTPVAAPGSISASDGLPEETLIPAVQEQLGLTLENHKTLTDRYTIEYAERPTAN